MLRLAIANCQLPIKNSILEILSIGNRHPLYCFAVIDRLLALLQGHVCLLPCRLAAFEAPAARHLAHEVNRSHAIDFYLKDCFHRRLDLGLGCLAIDPKAQQLTRVLRLFLRNQGLLSNHRRLDDVPNCSHYAASFLGLRARLGAAAFAGFFFVAGSSSWPSGSEVVASSACLGPSNCSNSATADCESTNFS